MERSIPQAYDRPVAEVIVGRDAELASLSDFVAGIADGASALVLEGEAGMGKTTLWRGGVEAAESAQCCVLQAQPAESETTLSFSGLGDLLDPVLDEALAPLAPGQRSALARALVLEDVDDAAPDVHAAGVALLNVLRGLASASSVVVAVDDVQWVDAATAGALSYATRRLRSEPVRVLLARRTGLDSSLVEELRRSDRYAELEVGPLDPASLHEVVRARLDISLPRPLLGEVHSAAGGNPFYALEIVQTLVRSGLSVEAGKPLPVPASLHDLVHGRLRALPQECRDFLAAAAAHASPTISTTEAASGVERASGLLPALDAGVVEIDGDEIRFAHPLLAAGALETADVRRRREIHARLAELLENPEARAWQLAAATELPDDRVAAQLEEAASALRARGARRAAALLLERSAALTPAGDDDDTTSRLVQAAYDHHAAGDTERACSILEPVLARTSRGPERAGVLVALARFRSYDDDVRGASALYREAVAEAQDESLVEAYAQEGLAGTLFRLREQLSDAVDVASAAAATARRSAAPQLEAEALATQAVSAAALGRPEAGTVAEAAVALQPACVDRPVLRQPQFAAMCVRFWHDDLDAAYVAYDAMATAARELGDESSLPYTYVMIGQIECARGRFSEAHVVADAGRAIAEQAGQRALIAYTLAVRALAQAHLGDVDRARASSEEALELAKETSGVPAWIFATWAAGHVELASGDPAGAVEIFRPLVEHHEREGIREPGALPFLPDAIEALLQSGRVEEAEKALEGYAGAAERLERARGIVAARRLRGMLVAARGDLAHATQQLESAVELSSQLPTPFDEARARLALGVVQRRAKRRREARATLEEALGIFERVGAALWAERARAELKRISGRAATSGALTPAEERVAALVAEGKTNKEVAAALFLSDRTVEGHVSHIFGKLGIRHRAEVAGALHLRGIGASNTGNSPVSAGPSAP
jgi:DNA-binding CsgD family transcriptional regulator